MIKPLSQTDAQTTLWYIHLAVQKISTVSRVSGWTDKISLTVQYQTRFKTILTSVHRSPLPYSTLYVTLNLFTKNSVYEIICMWPPICWYVIYPKAFTTAEVAKRQAVDSLSKYFQVYNTVSFKFWMRSNKLTNQHTLTWDLPLP